MEVTPMALFITERPWTDEDAQLLDEFVRNGEMTEEEAEAHKRSVKIHQATLATDGREE
jgi:polyhydroxyalkanoate synthesis regulator phasin